jgi:hypothetical protein
MTKPDEKKTFIKKYNIYIYVDILIKCIYLILNIWCDISYFS